jgi:hypothetical protein
LHCSQVRDGYSHEYLPQVIPVVAFPSTEIFIAAAKNLTEKACGKKPGELKTLLYGTTELQTSLKKTSLEKR